MYDYLVVGTGLFGAVFAHEATLRGKKCLVVDKRSHIGGNIYTNKRHDITVHQYGAHIFHTDNKSIWEYVNQFAEFNRYTNEPVAYFEGAIYNLPFNMNTFSKMWNIRTPEAAKAIIEKQINEANIGTPRNLEEQAISMVGYDIYHKLVEGYTQKQWGRPCKELPSSIIKRLPVRFVYDNNYFNDKYQGIPVGGYTQIIDKLLSGSDVKLDTNYLKDREYLDSCAKTIIYTGMIDEYFDYCFGELEYRSLRFESELLNIENFQGNAVVNYTEYSIPYTRIIEHKHFEFCTQNGIAKDRTIITREYPCSWKKGDEPYYPINDTRNLELYERYRDLAAKQEKVIFGGRLGLYKYFDMDDTIEAALKLSEEELA